MKSHPECVEAIILDGNQRSALAAARSLGAHGVRVAVGSEALPSIASGSRYCSGSFTYVSPYVDQGAFIESLREYASAHKGAVLFPMTDVTLGSVLEREAELSALVRIPFAGFDRYSAASDKAGLFRTAADLGLPIPETLFSSEYGSMENLVEDAAHMGFPVVAKPARSRFRLGNSWLNAGVRYAADARALRSLLGEEPFKSFPFVVQERVVGPGVGVFLLMREGEILASFAHRRIREKPPSGGVSVICESIRAPAEALSSAAKLLGRIGWTGVAMVEFKWDRRDNLPKLMEINARFWGSLQLAVSAGVDFPYLLFRMSRGEEIAPATGYRIGLQSRWELGDLDHLIIRMRKAGSQLSLPPGAPSKWEVLTGFLGDFFKPRVRNEMLRPDDPGPFLCELKDYFRDVTRVRT